MGVRPPPQIREQRTYYPKLCFINIYVNKPRYTTRRKVKHKDLPWHSLTARRTERHQQIACIYVVLPAASALRRCFVYVYDSCTEGRCMETFLSYAPWAASRDRDGVTCPNPRIAEKRHLFLFRYWQWNYHIISPQPCCAYIFLCFQVFYRTNDHNNYVYFLFSRPAVS